MKRPVLMALATFFTLGLVVPQAFADNTVTRISGANRYSTAAAVVKNFYPDAQTIYLATGRNFPDALAVGPAAAATNGALLLVDGNNLSRDAISVLAKSKAKRIAALGGFSAVSDEVLTQASKLVPGSEPWRLLGDDRYATASNISTYAWPNGAQTAYIASGESFPDALAGGALAAKNKMPILLVSATGKPVEAIGALQALKVKKLVVIGGEAVVPTKVLQDIQKDLGNIAEATRISGADRYATAKAVLDAGWPGHTGKVFYASAQNFPDALAGVPVAGRTGNPIMLTGKNDTPYPMNNPGWVLGGPNAVNDNAWNIKRAGDAASVSKPVQVAINNPEDPNNCTFIGYIPGSSGRYRCIPPQFTLDTGNGWMCLPDGTYCLNAFGPYKYINEKIVTFYPGGGRSVGGGPADVRSIGDMKRAGATEDQLRAPLADVGSSENDPKWGDKDWAWEEAVKIRSSHGVSTLRTCEGSFTTRYRGYGGDPAGDGSIWAPVWNPNNFLTSEPHTKVLTDPSTNFIVIKEETLGQSHGTNYPKCLNGTRDCNKNGLAIIVGTCS